MSEMTLLDEILAGETAELEFKEARTKDALKYVKTAVAFANGRGGRLVFGVEDGTRRIVGVDAENVFKEVDAIVDAISNACEPSIPLTTKIANVENRPLIVVEVSAGRHTPYYVKKLGMKEGTFVRVAATTRLAEPAVLKTLLIDGENKSFDLLPVKGRSVTKAEALRTARMMTKTARENCLTDEEAKRIKPMTVERLVSMGLLCELRGKLVPTNGYLIVAGADVPGIRPPRVRCRAYRGTDKTVWYDQRECEGPVAEQIHDAYAFVCKNMRVGSELVDTRRRDVYELPVGSVREAICNAVFHRNYLEPSEVYVALYDDRLEITSPGGLVRDMTIEQARHGYSKIRNDGLALALSYMKEVEGWGGGVARYFADWTAAGLPPPRLKESPGFFTVVFERKKKGEADEPVNGPVNEPVNEPLNEPLNCSLNNAIMQAIQKTPGIGRPMLMQIVGRSRATVTRALADLVGKGLVEHRGSDKTGGYYPIQSEKVDDKRHKRRRGGEIGSRGVVERRR